jgi:hypothetical protein
MTDRLGRLRLRDGSNGTNGQKYDRVDKRQYPVNSYSHNPKWQQEQPNDRVADQRGERKRP